MKVCANLRKVTHTNLVPVQMKVQQFGSKLADKSRPEVDEIAAAAAAAADDDDAMGAS